MQVTNLISHPEYGTAGSTASSNRFSLLLFLLRIPIGPGLWSRHKHLWDHQSARFVADSRLTTFLLVPVANYEYIAHRSQHYSSLVLILIILL